MFANYDKTMLELNKVCSIALKVRGMQERMQIAQEECAEFITAVSHYLRKRERVEFELVEETVDLFIVTYQMLHVVQYLQMESIFDSVLEKKIARLMKIVSEENDKEV